MLRSAGERLTVSALSDLGMDGERLLALVRERVIELQREETPVYRDLDIPLTDPALVPLTEPAADSSRLAPAIIHRHRLRDRSDVVEARLAALEARRRARRR